MQNFNNYSGSDITLIDGQALPDIPSLERGKLTWAVKAIRKVYNKLPSKVKTVIASYTGLTGFLNLIEHYTGTLENGIYNACIKVGMPKSTANFVKKTVMLFI